jgi:hypothetical protein
MKERTEKKKCGKEEKFTKEERGEIRKVLE